MTGRHRRGRHPAEHDGAEFRGTSPEQDRHYPDPESRTVIEPDRDAADDVTAEERWSRQAAHTDREPVDDFHLADDHAGQRPKPRPQEAPRLNHADDNH